MDPSAGDKSEAIRKKYCLENDKVFEDEDDSDVFRELQFGTGNKYFCFSASELDSIYQNGKLYLIKRIKN